MLRWVFVFCQARRFRRTATIPPALGPGSCFTFRCIMANTPCKSHWARLRYNHMVVVRKESDEALNQLFRALADGTRRDILARSLTETPSVSALAAPYKMSFAAVQKHVAVLERAGLIQKRAHGREQLVSTNHEIGRASCRERV